jgi:hypothetical protein
MVSHLPPVRSASAWTVIREGLGVSADMAALVGLAVLILPLLAAVAAFLTGFWPITLALLLAASLSLNVFLAYRLQVTTRRVGRVREAVEAVFTPAAQRQTNNTVTKPAGWLRDPADAGPLCEVTEAELDRALQRVETVARDILGEDAVVVSNGYYARVAPNGGGSFFFLGHSRIGEKSATFLVEGPESQPVVSTVTREAESPIYDHPPRPWHLDRGWKDLVRRVWAKERPFTGDLWLDYDENGWRVRIAAIRSGISDPPRTYHLRGSDLLTEAR